MKGGMRKASTGLAATMGKGYNVNEDLNAYAGRLDKASRFALADLPSWSPGFFCLLFTA